MAENTAVKNESKEAQLAKASRMNMIRSILPVVGLVGIFLLFNILTGGGMVKSKNLLLSQVYVTVISAMGVFFIMTMGGLDFSQGSIMGMASIAVCMLSKYNIVLAILGGILTGAVIGAFNGFFYVNRKIKSFIVTICSMFAASMKVYDFDNMPFKLTLTLIVLVIGFVIFRFTKFGMYLKAIGAGEKAAMFAGIRTDRMKFLIYVLSGAITGLAAFLNVAKNGSATANAGNQLETQILIALVLGGMPISGGAKVRFSNIVVGSMLYVVLQNGLQMMGMSVQIQQLIQGVVFLVFVAIFADRQSLKVIK